jgi:hypothetical protein
VILFFVALLSWFFLVEALLPPTDRLLVLVFGVVAVCLTVWSVAT